MKREQMLVVTLTLCVLTSLSAADERLEKQRSCDVSRGVQRHDGLQAMVPSDGKFVFRPGGPGFVDPDGALGIKMGWGRPAGTELIVGGRRLDAEAPPARAYMNDGYRDVDGQPIYLVFPTPGCWRITGRVGDQSLTLTVLVELEGNGPNWKSEALPADGFWYQTTLESGRTMPSRDFKPSDPAETVVTLSTFDTLGEGQLTVAQGISANIAAALNSDPYIETRMESGHSSPSRDFILKGTVYAEGQRAFVALQLVDASTTERVWSENYDYRGIGTDEMAAAIRAYLQSHISEN